MRKIKAVVLILASLFFIALAGYNIIIRTLTNQLLKRNAAHAHGVVIDEKNYLGNSPVSHAFSYSYQFIIDGKIYKNDSHIPNLNVGDTIKILYVKNWPNLNKPEPLPK